MVKSPARILFIIGGLVSVGLGIIGVIVPGLPTTPFVLLAGYFFARSSNRLHSWLVSHRVFGKILRDFRENGGVSKKGKIVALGSMWPMIALSVYFHRHSWVAISGMILLGVTGTLFILLYKSTKRSDSGEGES